MDWVKAKNIIVIVLILLNLFLFINVLIVLEPLDFTGQNMKNAKQALETAGIVVTGNIPMHNKPVARISFVECDSEKYRGMIRSLTGIGDDSFSNPRNNQWNVNGRKLEINGDTFVYTDDTGTANFPVNDRKKLNQKLLSWIRRNKISSQRFIQNSIMEENGTITVEYIQTYQKIPLFSNRIIFTIEGGQLKKAEGSMRIFDRIMLSKAKDQVVSANIVLLAGKDKIREIVQSIDLGYLQTRNEDLYDTPVWRVTFISGEKAWFNAYTGEWIDYS